MDPNQLPTANTPSTPPNAGGDQGHKKALLKKLMDHVLSKPIDSIHDTINSVKSAIGAYKNYSKEWDNLHGMGGEGQASDVPGGPKSYPSQGMPQPAMPAQSKNSIQDIMQKIQEQKGQAPRDNMPVMQAPPSRDNMPVMQAPPSRDNMPTSMPITAPRTMPLPPHPTQMPIQAPTSMPPNPPSQPPSMIAGPDQHSSFNRPAPVNSLGIFGH